MKEIIQPRLKSVGSFGELFSIVCTTLQEVKEKGQTRIGYVSGIISSDGPDKIQENIERLQRITEILRGNHKFPIFSATDIFTNEVYERCTKDSVLLNTDFIQFWRNLLGAGFVTDVFMTPRWEFSEGATDEHLVADELGLNIHYFNFTPNLL